ETNRTSSAFFFSSRRRHTRCLSDWSSDVCSSDLTYLKLKRYALAIQDYNQSLLLRPNHVNTLVERGIANFDANQYPAARLDFEEIGRASCREREEKSATDVAAITQQYRKSRQTGA